MTKRRWRTIFVRRAQQSGTAVRKAMIDRTHDLPVSRQARAANGPVGGHATISGRCKSGS